jgi:DNA-directed RNA polymerase subunit L
MQLLKLPRPVNSKMAPPSAKIVSCTDQTISLVGTPFESLQDAAPTVVNRKLIFQVNGGSCELVNAIRRTLVSEMPVKHLTAALSDIKTTDPYLIGEAILKRIEMVPIAQSVDLETKFSLRFENNTDKCVDVLSTEILQNGKTRSSDITPCIPICDINPSTEFVVSNIYVAQSYGYSNSRVSIGSVGYEILDEDFSKSSLMASPTKFSMQIETPGVLDPVEMVRRAIDCLIERLGAIDYSSAITEFGIYKLKIPNETYSIGRLLTCYIPKIDKSVSYVACRILHPSQREVVVDIMHPSGEALSRKAAEAAAEDLKTLKDIFA